ncbi:hypothetical protein GCM10020367_17530 [Streptomyces sannanensis]|uniref:Uncharacterized protein n=1 Tax=Streptomyces sannanensis TaxID=285536 RepID=A0ABP6S845_9ACTN
MVTARHETMHRIFPEDPELFTRVFERLLGTPLPKPRAIAVLKIGWSSSRAYATERDLMTATHATSRTYFEELQDSAHARGRAEAQAEARGTRPSLS